MQLAQLEKLDKETYAPEDHDDAREMLAEVMAEEEARVCSDHTSKDANNCERNKQRQKQKSCDWSKKKGKKQRQRSTKQTERTKSIIIISRQAQKKHFLLVRF